MRLSGKVLRRLVLPIENNDAQAWCDSMSILKFNYFGSIVKPRPFAAPEVESRFIRQYRSVGLRWSRSAAVIGLVLIISFWAIVAIKVPSIGMFEGRQMLRGLVALFLIGFLVFSIICPRFSLKYYPFVAGVPVFAICFFLVAMALLPPEADYQKSSRFSVAMILTLWLIYGFTRVSALLALSMCVSASILVIMGLYLSGDDYFLAMSLYLVMANVVGWAVSVSAERRERELFLAKRRLVEMAGRMRRAARDSHESNLEKGRILAAISHDLSQPIGSLIIYLDRLKEQLGVDSEQIGLVVKARICAEIVGESVERISEASSLVRMEGGQALEEIDLGLMIVRLKEVLLGVATRRSVRLVVDVDVADELVGVTNYALMWDVLSNIVANSIKYSSRRSEDYVVIRARRRGSSIGVLIVDNGIGIPDVSKRLVFEKYYQVGQGQSRGGFGLGLSIVRESIGRLSGHRLLLRSRVGRGTAFRILVPGAGVIAANVVETESDVSVVEHARKGSRWRSGAYILVVSASIPRCLNLSKVLEESGSLVEVASSALDARRLVESSERFIDVVVVDVSEAGVGWADEVLSSVEVEQGSRLLVEVLVDCGVLEFVRLASNRVLIRGLLESEEGVRDTMKFLDDSLDNNCDPSALGSQESSRP